MIRLARDFRLIPVVLIATICLFALKSFGLIFKGGYTLHDPAAERRENLDVTGSIADAKAKPALLNEVNSRTFGPAPRQSWAQQMFGYPDVTGSAAEPKPAPKQSAPA